MIIYIIVIILLFLVLFGASIYFLIKTRPELPPIASPFPPSVPKVTPLLSPLWSQYQNTLASGFTASTPYDTTAISASGCAIAIQSAATQAGDDSIVGWSFVVTPSGTSCRAASITNMTNACFTPAPANQTAYTNQTMIDYYSMKQCS